MLREKFKVVKRNKIFRFLSSIRLAVPMLLIIACVVSVGTVIESRYSAEYAKMTVYNTSWFAFLLLVIGINILFAALSRFPWKKQQTGFVITHLGMITLLMGSWVTAEWGIDGNMRVEEGTSNNRVFLSTPVVQVQGQGFTQKVELKSLSSSQDQADLDYINDVIGPKIVVEKFWPFVEYFDGYEESPDGTAQSWAVGVQLKSQFFNVSEWLHSSERPELQMGPAKLRIYGPNSSPPIIATKKVKDRDPADEDSKTSLLVYEAKSDKLIRKIPVYRLRKSTQKVGPLKIALTGQFEKAMVGPGKIVEGGKFNPALEILVDNGGKKVREVLFSRFPQFSINKEGIAGYRFEYDFLGEEPKTQSGTQAVSISTDRSGNVIEFHAISGSTDKIKVSLYKDNKEVLSQTVQTGQVLQTPWMGMQLIVGSIKKGAKPVTNVRQVELKEKQDLPPSAVFVRTQSAPAGNGVWITEGQSKSVQINGNEHVIYFGPDSIKLPFTLHLDQFFKKDYPGTSTPLSFESHVNIDGAPDKIVVSMNEPLSMAGFTLYQASYDMGPGRRTASVFSVNQDPGRWIKYFGSFLMGLGIITYTLMRSSWYRTVRSVK